MAEPPSGDEDRTRAVAWRPIDIVWAVLAGLGLGIAASTLCLVVLSGAGISPSEPVLLSLVTLAIYSGLLGGVYLVVVRRRGVSFTAIGFARVRAGTLVLMLPLALLMLILVGLTITATTPLLGEPPSRTEQLVLDRGAAVTGGEKLLLFVDAAIAAPVVEELVFRGLIYRSMRSRWGLVPAVAASSALFAVVHPYVPLLPALFLLGAMFALVAERYGSLYPPVLLHGINNGLAVLLIGVV